MIMITKLEASGIAVLAQGPGLPHLRNQSQMQIGIRIRIHILILIRIHIQTILLQIKNLKTQIL